MSETPGGKEFSDIFWFFCCFGAEEFSVQINDLSLQGGSESFHHRDFMARGFLKSVNIAQIFSFGTWTDNSFLCDLSYA